MRIAVGIVDRFLDFVAERLVDEVFKPVGRGMDVIERQAEMFH